MEARPQALPNTHNCEVLTPLVRRSRHSGHPSYQLNATLPYGERPSALQLPTQHDHRLRSRPSVAEFAKIQPARRCGSLNSCEFSYKIVSVDSFARIEISGKDAPLVGQAARAACNCE